MHARNIVAGLTYLAGFGIGVLFLFAPYAKGWSKSPRWVYQVLRATGAATLGWTALATVSFLGSTSFSIALQHSLDYLEGTLGGIAAGLLLGLYMAGEFPKPRRKP
jgi:hypothetical protein